jgi:thiol-disulfide isomerase/thioredoxin
VAGAWIAILAGLVGLGGPPVGEPAPALEGAPGGQPGQVTLVMFFATWCGPCHRAFRELAAINDALGSRARMVLVEAGEPPDEVRRFLASNPPPPGAVVGTDISGETRRRWNVNQFPTFFEVGRDGIVQRMHHGWSDHSAGALIHELHLLLGDPPPGRPHARSGPPTSGPPPPPARGR